MTNVLTLEEVANYLRVHPSTVYRMLKKRQIPAFKVGSDWRFNLESIDHWRSTAERGEVVEGS
jgi:excisionase family DNA binding protein